MLSAMLRVISYVLVFCIPTALYAQTPTAQPRFALEIQDPARVAPQYVLVQEGQGIQQSFLTFGQTAHRLEVREAGDSKTVQQSAVELNFKINGEVIAITASVVFGPFAENDKNRSLEGRPHHSIGSYSVRLSESVVLQEMEQFGLQPWTIAVVTAQPPRPTILPHVSRVPSIQAEIVSQDREGYMVSLRNRSPQGVTAFVVANSFHDASTLYGERSDRGSLIGSGESHEMRYPCDTTANMTPTGAAAVPCAFVLEAALFADGSYEGDPGAAASLAATQLAEESQRRRVAVLVQSILLDSTASESTQIARIRSEVPSLPEQPDPAIVEQLHLTFPGLSPSEWPSVNADMKTALARQKQMTLEALEIFENSTRSAFSTKSLAEWWFARQN